MVAESGFDNLARAIREFALVYLVCNAPKGVSFIDKHNLFEIVGTEEGYDASKQQPLRGDKEEL